MKAIDFQETLIKDDLVPLNSHNPSNKIYTKTMMCCSKVKPTTGCVIRLLIAILLVSFIVYIIADFSTVKHFILAFIKWLQDNILLGTFLLIMIYILATVLFVPGLLLTIGTGVALRAALHSTWQALLLGSLAVWVAAMVGSLCAMLLGRYLLRKEIEKRVLKLRIFRAIDSALKKEGFKFTLLLRLCPLIPFAFLSYVLGLTSVSVGNFLLGGLGMIPGTVAYVYLGTTISNIAIASMGGFSGGPVELTLIILGCVLAIVAVVLVTLRAKKELSKLMEQERKEEEEREGALRKEGIDQRDDNDAEQKGDSSRMEEAGQ